MQDHITDAALKFGRNIQENPNHITLKDKSELAGLPADFIAAQRKAIVGVEIEIADIRGKWKTSQNRSAADRAGVVAGLEALGDEEARAMAAIVKESGGD